MLNSREIQADVLYLKDGEWHSQSVEFGALPRAGEEVVFHGAGWDYMYKVDTVIWHLKPGKTEAGVLLPDESYPVVRIGACIEREEVEPGDGWPGSES